MLILAAFSLFTPARALAYRTLSDLPELRQASPVAWPGAFMRFELSSHDLPSGVDPSVLAIDLESALAAWRAPACASLTIENLGIVSTPARLGDGRNTVQFVTSGWAKLGYAPDQAGVTEVDYARVGTSTWFIAEADLLINAEDFSWGAEGRPLHSLFLHEGGHMLGLLHPCEQGGAGAPDCRSGAFDALAMYPFYDPGQLELGDDDRGGICFLYPSVAVSVQGDFACSVDADCGLPRTCGANGICEVRPRAVGESCQSSTECESGDCAAGGLCASGPRDFGQVCVDSADCDSGQCLVGGTSEPVCTRLCGGPVTCPANWDCTTVDDREVCTPDAYRAGGGCSLASGARARGSLELLILLFTVSYVRRRRAST